MLLPLILIVMESVDINSKRVVFLNLVLADLTVISEGIKGGKVNWRFNPKSFIEALPKVCQVLRWLHSENLPQFGTVFTFLLSRLNDLSNYLLLYLLHNLWMLHQIDNHVRGGDSISLGSCKKESQTLIDNEFIIILKCFVCQKYRKQISSFSLFTLL